jgi:hypothetical protein
VSTIATAGGSGAATTTGGAGGGGSGAGRLAVQLVIAAMISACGRNEPPPVELWFGGDVYLAQPRKVVDPALAAMLVGDGIVNLEGPVGTALPGEQLRLVHSADTVAHGLGFGVAAADVANNHAGDAGPDGPAATASALGDADVVAFGGDVVGSVDGLVLAGFDLSDGVPADLADRLAAAHPDVVAFHVAGDASPEPTPDLRAAVDLAIASGADVVVAHGTHVFGPVERRGDTVIAWGLGNLAFDCACTNHTDGLVVRVSLAPGHPASVIPIQAGLEGALTTLAPDPDAYFDTLGALSPSPLVRDGAAASF